MTRAMYAQDDTQQRTELRLAFLRHLPRRIEMVARRTARFCRDGWDINGLSLLLQDVQRLAGAAGRYGELETSSQLQALEAALSASAASGSLPDAQQSERLLALAAALAPLEASAPMPAEAPTGSPTIDAAAPRFEVAPAQYWLRWTGDAAPPQPVQAAPQQPAAAAPESATTASAAAPSRGPVNTPVVRRATPPAEPAPVAALAAEPARMFRIYHLTDADGLALEVDQRLEALGMELELLETADELKEVLAALAPDLVLIGTGYSEQLEDIGAVLRATRERTGSRLPLLALAEADSVPVRLSARRAGADALLVQPSAEDVVARVRELLDPDREEAFRVLVVEDDRSQGLFAESILRNAGMDPMVVDDAFQVLDALQRFQPDLVLMDLYMPGCDGTELTALIREREEFLHTPIVFLSGESDQDKHFAALDAGGDDFLAKPIRPKYLISAVNNRIRRARALHRRSARKDPRDPASGLYDRAHLLDRINEALGAEEARSAAGGVLYVEVDGAAQLRERLGLSTAEQVFADVGTVLQAAAGERDAMVTRLGEGGFLVLCPGCDDAALDALASAIRVAIAGHAFTAGTRALRLRPSIGVCAFRHGFADAAALLNAVERSTREARAREDGIQRFEPPRRAEQERETQLVALLRDAVEGDAFELLYQPIVAVQGGEQAQYQALVRLRDDAGRLHSAGEIVPLAERADLIVDMDRWVLTQAMRVIEQRQAEHRPVRLFVSQSPVTLATRDHAEWLAAQVEARKLPNGTLIVELRADELSAQRDLVAAFCSALVPHGVQFCLSHFEHGREQEALLGQLPVDFVKLAPRYLRAADTQQVRDELRTVVDAAHARGAEVIAQRVEDARAAASLWMSGIDFLQGNLVQQAARALEFDFGSAVL